MEGVALLEDEGFGWGVIYVVTKPSLDNPLELFHFLTNLRPGGSVSFNPVLLYDDKVEHLRITPSEFVDFLGAIFPLWWRHRARYPHVEPFNSLTRNLIYNERSLSCNNSGECAYSHINLAADGRVSQCGRSFDWGLLDYGSIFDHSFSQDSSMIRKGRYCSVETRFFLKESARDAGFGLYVTAAVPLIPGLSRSPSCIRALGVMQKRASSKSTLNLLSKVRMRRIS